MQKILVKMGDSFIWFIILTGIIWWTVTLSLWLSPTKYEIIIRPKQEIKIPTEAGE